MKGHTVEDFSFKEGDSLKFAIKASTTDKFLVFATNGRFYTLSGDKLPRGRGHGEPVRLMIDLPNDADIVQMMIFKPEQKLLVVSAEGKGMIVKTDDVMAQTRAGKVVLNLDDNEEAALCVPAEGDSVAIIGQNRKLLIFPLSEVPEQARGKGVILQKYKDGKVSDVQVFNKADGLSWMQAERLRNEKNIKEWIGQRAQAGHQPPQGFPRSNKFR
jgi:topoisomerase-4 subunit A